MTAVVALWHGGSGYGHGYAPEDLEYFPTITAARQALQGRLDNRDRYYPCVYADSGSYMDLWEAELRHPVGRAIESQEISERRQRRGYTFTYGSMGWSVENLGITNATGDPFQRLEVGPRGGIVRTSV